MLLITGITGHSGKYFFSELLKNKYTEKIKIIVRNEETLTFIQDSGLDIETQVGDLSNESFLTKSLENVDTLFHIASIFYSENVVKAAIINKVSRIIVVHTTGIYSQFKSASEEYKLIEENINDLISNASHTIDFTILRPTMIFGYLNDRNMIKFIQLADKLPLLPLIDYGKGLIQPVHGKDLGKAYYQVLVSKNLERDYILSGERALTMSELFNLIGKYLDKRIFFINVPNRIGVFFAQLLKLISFNKIDYVERVQRMSENRSFSHELATKDFNYSPSSFNDSLKDEVQIYLNSKVTKI
jgi:uncharacterized protein YbjT (DUF2867 family)